MVVVKGWVTSWHGGEFESLILGALIFGTLFAEKITVVDNDDGHDAYSD